jgi:hydroxyacylglutathione hydrolase
MRRSRSASLGKLGFVLIVDMPLGPLAANCYLLAVGEDAPCVVVDPGQQALGPVSEAVARHRLRPQAVLLTHGHFDHVWSAAALCERYGIAAHIHPGDAELLREPAKGLDPALESQLSALFGGEELAEPERVEPLADGQILDLAGLALSVSHAPGHTPGSVTFSVPGDTGDTAAILFSGDLLFAGSIGRTDFPGGDHPTMMDSLARVCLALPDNTEVRPGHGPATTIGRERVANPFLRGM